MKLLSAIKNAESYALSDVDIHKVLPNILIIPYHDLANTKLEELLITKDKYGNEAFRFILLMESTYNSGHYVSISYLPDKNLLSFWESYGIHHDKLIKKLSYSTRGLDSRPYLNLLFDNFTSTTKCRIEYNNVPFQQSNQKIATCGRWAIYRSIYSSLTNSEFNKMMQEVFNYYKIPYDDLITMLTLIISY